jgi:hypothetical protein
LGELFPSVNFCFVHFIQNLIATEVTETTEK